jgi:hypothetical protein
MKIWFAIFTVYLMTMTVLFACDGGEEVKGPVIQPKKESTWVRTEKVQTTKEEVFSNSKKVLAKIPINASLIEKILTKKFSSDVAIDKNSCLKRFDSLDLRRTLVQKFGGMWGAFERNEDSKSYSFNGMQLDSNINKIIFSLGYLCKTSEGVPLNNVAIEFKKLLQDYGLDETKKILISRGEHPKDIENYLNYEEFARKISARKIDYKMINSRLDKAERLIYFYEDFYKKSIKEQAVDEFLSNTATLLKITNEFIQTDQVMAMVLNEDKLVPYNHIDQDM